MTSSWIGNFGRISSWFDENCRFFIKSTFLCQSYFLLLIPWIQFEIITKARTSKPLLTCIMINYLKFNRSQKLIVFLISICISKSILSPTHGMTVSCIKINTWTKFNTDAGTQNRRLLHKPYWNRATLSHPRLHTLKFIQKPWALVSKQIRNRSFKWGTKHWFWSRGCKDTRGQSWSLENISANSADP